MSCQPKTGHFLTLEMESSNQSTLFVFCTLLGMQLRFLNCFNQAIRNFGNVIRSKSAQYSAESCVVMGPGMYVQHMNCEPKSAIHPHRHSNEFHSWFFNMTSFNTGFHLIHHDRPGVHWYDLEKHHDERREELIEDDYRVLPFGFYRAAFRQELMSGSHRIQ